MKCEFRGCYRNGHLKAIHFPKKTETVQRLKSKYGPDFQIIQPQTGSEGWNKRGPQLLYNRDDKKSRGELRN